MAFISEVSNRRLKVKHTLVDVPTPPVSVHSPRRLISDRPSDPSPEPGTGQSGITLEHSFQARLRTVAATNSLAEAESIRMWCGESGGQVTSRRAVVAGRDEYDIHCEQPIPDDARVTCCVALHWTPQAETCGVAQDFMCVAFDDGLIRVFRKQSGPQPPKSTWDEAGNHTQQAPARHVDPAWVGQPGDRLEYKWAFDCNRRHVREVTCMVAVYPDDDLPYIVTGGRDWQVNSWHFTADGSAAKGSVRIWSGDQAAITCLCNAKSDGRSMLFCGSDNGVIRCMYLDRAGRREHEPVSKKGWPVTCGKGTGLSALAANDRYLFSAGKDGSLRLWQLETGHPVHLGGTSSNVLHKSDCPITRLLMVNKQLWSGGQDGIVRVWHTDSSACAIGVVDIPPGSDDVQLLSEDSPDSAPMSSSAFCRKPSSGDRVSVASVGRFCVRLANGGYLPKENVRIQRDGFEHGTYTPWLAAVLEEHRGGSVTDMKPSQQGLTGTMAWVAAGGSVCLHYIESDWADGAESRRLCGYNAQEQAGLASIGQLRGELLRNFKEVSARREWHGVLDRRVNRRVELIGDNLSKHSDRETKAWYLNRLLHWASARASLQRRSILAGCMRRVFGLGLEQIYFDKLRMFAKERRDKQREMVFMKNLLASSDKGLQVLYWQHLCEFARRKESAKRHREFAQSILRSTDTGLRTLIYGKWTRWMYGRRLQKKKLAVAEALLVQSDKGLKSVYYQRLLEFHRKEAERASRRTVVDIFASMKDRDFLLHDAYGRLLRFRRQARYHKSTSAMAEALAMGSESVLVRVYNKKCFDWVKERHTERAKLSIEEVKRQAQRLDDLLGSMGRLSEADILAERQQLEDAIRDGKSEMDELPQRIRKMRMQNGELERELLMTYEPPGETGEEKLTALLLHVKANGCNCKYDRAEIKRIRQERSTEWSSLFKGAARATVEAMEHPLSPVRTVEDGLTKVRSCVQESFDSIGMEHSIRGRRPAKGETWEIPVDVVLDMPESKFRRCHDGVVEIIIGWDQIMSRERTAVSGLKTEEEIVKMQSTLQKYTVENKTKGEITKNATWIIAIVHRMVKSRHQVEMDLIDAAKRQADEQERLREPSPQQRTGSPSGSPTSSRARRTGSPRRAQDSEAHSVPALARSGGSSRRVPTVAPVSPTSPQTAPSRSGSARARPGSSSARGAPSPGSSGRRPVPAGSSSRRSAPGSTPGSGSARAVPAVGSSSSRSAPKPAAKRSGSSRRRPAPTR